MTKPNPKSREGARRHRFMISLTVEEQARLDACRGSTPAAIMLRVLALKGLEQFGEPNK